MIRLERAGIKMEVGTDVQASAFLKNGWTICEEAKAKEVVVHEPEVVEATFSKTEINRMPLADLRVLAEKEGIKDFAEKSGAELKKLLIKKFDL